MTQSLKLHPDFFGSIRPGELGADIRYGKRDIKVGPLTFEATDGSKKQTVRVCNVYTTPVYMLDKHILDMRGQNDYQEVIDGLIGFYPDMTYQSEVTVILYDVERDD